MQLGERLRKRVAADPFVVSVSEALDVTISGGCATGDGCNPDDVVRRADRALDSAKESGRNRIIGDEPAILDTLNPEEPHPRWAQGP